MTEAIVITPVKDSILTTKKTIHSILQSQGKFDFIVFNDFSLPETKSVLKELSTNFGFTLIHLEELTNFASPNYKLVLEIAQKKALQKNVPLIIIESDVVVKENTIRELLSCKVSDPKLGMVGAITTDETGNYNFPYTDEKIKMAETIFKKKSLSFCCTLLSTRFLRGYDFENLPEKKHWFDLYISRKSDKIGFNNYLAKNIEVVHLPHSSRPWKNLKYKKPVLYYIEKYSKKRDRT